MAERIKEAIELKAFERNGHQPPEAGATEGEFANRLLSYNVFVVTGTPQVTLFPSIPLRGLSISYLISSRDAGCGGVPQPGQRDEMAVVVKLFF